ncbi:ISL3 family transposase [Nocardia rhamnosiphila]
MAEVSVGVGVVFSGLSPLVVEDVGVAGSRLVVRARTPGGVAECPGCGAGSDRVHGVHERRLADLPVDGRSVVVRVRIRRLYCLAQGCQRTFREQVPGVLERYQRRTTRLTGHVRAAVRELAGRAAVRMLRRWSVRVSRQTAVRVLLGIPLQTQKVPRALSVDDFALLRRHRYGTVLIDAATHQRIDVLPDRRSATLETWLRAHPGVEFVVRDGSATYAEAIRRGAPTAIQIADRWHLWHNLVRAAEKVVAAHARCWAAAGPKRRKLTRETTTLARWHAIHNLLDHGVGLMDCARRLGLGLNTVKRYSRVSEPEKLRRPPQYRASLVDPYRDHLRARRASEPGVAVTTLLAEITDLGYTGSLNLLHKYLNQGRAESDRVMPSPRRLTSWITTRPSELGQQRHAHLTELLAACPDLTVLAELVSRFARIVTEHRGRDLNDWMSSARAAALPELDPFLRGIDRDYHAVLAGLCMPYSNGPVEGVNTKTKLIKRQMYGRAGFRLLRHRILLA